MSRPQLPKYVSRSEYTVELEKYCDELEERNKDWCEGQLLLFKEKAKVERALEKASYELMRFVEIGHCLKLQGVLTKCDRCPMKDDHCTITNWQCKDKLKEWLLKDD